MAMSLDVYYEPIYSIRLHEMGVSDSYIGFIFGIAPLFYAICCPIAGFLGDNLPRRWVIFVAFNVFAVG